MRTVLAAIGVLGLAAIFGRFEPMPASANPITLTDVHLVSEELPEQTSGRPEARTRNGKKNGKNPQKGVIGRSLFEIGELIPPPCPASVTSAVANHWSAVPDEGMRASPRRMVCASGQDAAILSQTKPEIGGSS